MWWYVVCVVVHVVVVVCVVVHLVVVCVVVHFELVCVVVHLVLVCVVVHLVLVCVVVHMMVVLYIEQICSTYIQILYNIICTYIQCYMLSSVHTVARLRDILYYCKSNES